MYSVEKYYQTRLRFFGKYIIFFRQIDALSKELISRNFLSVIAFYSILPTHSILPIFFVKSTTSKSVIFTRFLPKSARVNLQIWFHERIERENISRFFSLCTHLVMNSLTYNEKITKLRNSIKSWRFCTDFASVSTCGTLHKICQRDLFWIWLEFVDVNAITNVNCDWMWILG